MENLNLFFTILESGMSKIKGPVDLVSEENLFPGSLTAMFSLCPHIAEEVRDPSGTFFISAFIPS